MTMNQHEPQQEPMPHYVPQARPGFTTPIEAPMVIKDRSDILSTASHLINGDRNESYGDYGEQMRGLSQMFNGMTGKDLSPADCSKFLMCLKLRRLETATDTDSEIDLCGYAALHAEFFK